MSHTEKELVEICKQNIEAKFQFEKTGANIRQRDLEYLSYFIEEKSGISLSISTLKRLWKGSYVQSPHPTTLNALVSVLGYRDWLDFKMDVTKEKKVLEKPKATNQKKSRKKYFVYVGLAIVAVALSVFLFKGFKTEQNTIIGYADVQFSVDKTIARGVPSTVIFNYDVSSIEADSFFIQQDWDPRKKIQIDPDRQYFSSVYYTPGFHKAKLLAGDSQLKMQEVHVQTDDWVPAVYYGEHRAPEYLAPVKNNLGILSIDEAEKNIDMDEFSQFRFLNIRDFEGVDAHNFKIEAAIRHIDITNNSCPYMQMTIHTEPHIYYVPVTKIGCEGNIRVKIGEVWESANENNFSSFGTEIDKWQELTLTVENKMSTVFLNGEEIFKTTFKEDFGRIVGIDFRFSGFGEVDYVHMKTVKDSVVYKDDF